ncbi:hypothetical protein GH754_12775 [Salinibacillus xinjiangensis]|uniref:Uncharacterized protein n=1 Tax=Salinibacillus xinjiangensis TaxID=1229268 RepID=A0A6G1X8B3_9BACI|nr:hypothetical protein [Salinibacillus xinjiangensis]
MFVIIGSCLLIGTTRREKKWIGGTGGLLAVIFIVGSQIVKLQSGFFDSRTRESLELVGQWVLPCFFVLGLYILGMINYRMFKAAFQKTSWQRWGMIGLDILVSFLYIWAGGFVIFVIAFMYFPFAP